ncbi:prolipoprotein diacylglyceryl transferase [Reichenbachiella versicolor]|uniref:prolipoprotein diacylglyceryl transferase n=1 Tax=Reichenbachiella versicolor TaxID=1821036 RepID=UPI000D6E88B6|nr:prolipoprotein diacylglyceryl transferase [Reichenbachiella versicolor]
MDIINFIIWSPSPDMFVIPGIGHPVRWYGLLFAMAFIVGQYIMSYMFKLEGRNQKDIDKLTMYVIAGTIIGARLGHCLFYQPSYYLSNPIKILYVWEGGLASHGAAIALFISLYLFAKKFNYRYLWILDRVAIITILSGMMIRTGNFMNSEIIGKPTKSDYGVVFARSLEEAVLREDRAIEDISFSKGDQDLGEYVPVNLELTYKRGMVNDESAKAESIKRTIKSIISRSSQVSEHFALTNQDIKVSTGKKNNIVKATIELQGISRHPGQLYEAIACLVIFLILAHVYYHHRHQLNNGTIFGLFMVMLWIERFLVEFSKENQVGWEADIPLNMGQWLSIPMFLFGLGILIYSFKFGEKTEQ